MSRFPDPRRLPPGESVLAVGGDLSVAALLEAYGKGVFPWPIEPGLIPWCCPDPRGVLFFDRLHVPRSLKQARRRCAWTVTFDSSFSEVIRACAEAPRPVESGRTWIVPEMAAAYEKLHKAGHAHSAECWEDGELVGGVYGVYVGGVFSGESMFHRKDNASKAALWGLIERLGAAGLAWMDVQMVTPVVELFGGGYVSRTAYLDMLEAAHRARPPERLRLAG